MRQSFICAASAAAMLAFAWVSPAFSEECPLGTKQIGEREEDTGTVIKVHPLCQEMSVGELDGQLDQLGQRIATTRASLARLAMRGGNLQADIDEWTKLSDDARAEAHNQIMSALAGVGVAWLNERLKQQVKDVLLRDKRLQQVWPSIEGSPLQRLRASVLDQLRQAKSDQDVLKIIGEASTISGITLAVAGAYIDPKDLNQWLTAATTLLQPLVSDPVIQLALVHARLGVPVLYGYAVAYTERIALNDIIRIGEDQYKQASTLTQLYMKQLADRNELLRIRVERSVHRPR